MRLVYLILIILLTGCSKHPTGAWQPAPAAIATAAATAVASPPTGASVPRMTFPLHALDTKGRKAEPITVIVAATEAQLAEAFEKANWVTPEPLNEESLKRLRAAHAWSERYPNAPISPLHYWGRTQDAAWQRPGSTVASRVRVRVWRSEERDEAGRWLWALNVAQEEGISAVSGEPVHHLLPDIDRAADTLAQDLAQAITVKRQYVVKGIGPNAGFRTASGQPYWTAGWVRVLEL